MNITYMVPVNGKYVDLKTLPAAEQEGGSWEKNESS